MFVLVHMKDTIAVHPSAFSRDIRDALVEEIEGKYANKVVHEVGLCIALHSFTFIGDGRVFAGDGSAHVDVEFNIIVFRPFEGEILVGTVAGADEKGVKVSLGFTEDIHIPAYLLPTPSAFNEAERLWEWHYVNEHGTVDKYPILPSGAIRVRVVSTQWGAEADDSATTSTAGSSAADGAASVGAAGARTIGGAAAEAAADDAAARGAVGGAGACADGPRTTAPMTVIASIAASALGMVAWWNGGISDEAFADGHTAETAPVGEATSAAPALPELDEDEDEDEDEEEDADGSRAVGAAGAREGKGMGAGAGAEGADGGVRAGRAGEAGGEGVGEEGVEEEEEEEGLVQEAGGRAVDDYAGGGGQGEDD